MAAFHGFPQQPPKRPEPVPEPAGWEAVVRWAEKDDLLLYVTAALGVFMPAVVYFVYHKIHHVYEVYAEKKARKKREEDAEKSKIILFYASSGGATKKWAEILAEKMGEEATAVLDLATVDALEFSKFKGIGIFLISTMEGGSPPKDTAWFYDFLEDLAVDKKRRKKCGTSEVRFAVLGRGSSAYPHLQYNKAAKTLAKRLKILGAHALLPIEYFDDQSSDAENKGQFDEWCSILMETIEELGEDGQPEFDASSEGGSSSEESESSDGDDQKSSWLPSFSPLRFRKPTKTS